MYIIGKINKYHDKQHELGDIKICVLSASHFLGLNTTLKIGLLKLLKCKVFFTSDFFGKINMRIS